LEYCKAWSDGTLGGCGCDCCWCLMSDPDQNTRWVNDKICTVVPTVNPT
jgi:hypothetical protein